MANILMVMAALALCVSACTGPKTSLTGETSYYDAGSTHGSLLGLAHFG